MRNPPSFRRAGMVPHHVDPNGRVRVCLMIPSDPAYGGPDPQIAKGRIDPGEDALRAAWREAAEELGLRRDNAGDAQFAGNLRDIGIWACPIRDPLAFDPPHWETLESLWLYEDELDRARDWQRALLRAICIQARAAAGHTPA